MSEVLAFLYVVIWWVGLISITVTLAVLVLCAYVTWRDRLREHRFRMERIAAYGLFDYEQDGLDGRLR